VELVYEDREQAQSDDEEESADISEERLWLIQCKRERTIPPQKMASYADEIIKNSGLYGVIFTAACDFSRKSRDIFIAKLRSAGINEIHIWGKSELEDMLYQPKNDNLLFAYFGISLQVRRRSTITRIRGKLSIKKKLMAALGGFGGHNYKPVVIKSIDDKDYPHKSKLKKCFTWDRLAFTEFYYDGIVLEGEKYFAYIDDKNKKWDYISGANDSKPVEPYFLHSSKSNPEKKDTIDIARDFWNFKVPEKNKAIFKVLYLIPFDKIVAVDKEGDPIYQEPNIYVDLCGGTSPFDPRKYPTLHFNNDHHRETPDPEKSNRISFFPNELPEVTAEEKKKFFDQKQLELDQKSN